MKSCTRLKSRAFILLDSNNLPETLSYRYFCLTVIFDLRKIRPSRYSIKGVNPTERSHFWLHLPPKSLNSCFVLKNGIKCYFRYFLLTANDIIQFLISSVNIYEPTTPKNGPLLNGVPFSKKVKGWNFRLKISNRHFRKHTKLAIMIYQCQLCILIYSHFSSLVAPCIGGSKEASGTRLSLSGSKFFHFHAVFLAKIFQNNRLAHRHWVLGLLRKILDPPLPCDVSNYKIRCQLAKSDYLSRLPTLLVFWFWMEQPNQAWQY